MRFGFVMPFGDAGVVADFAVLAESTGWDAIFDWEAVWGDDAWISLTAAAMVTDRIRLGTMLTPIPRVRPWDLASRVSSLDRLSFGRVILGAGLGALHEGWTAFEADEGRKVRVEKMDEGLAIYAGLTAGQPFSFEGKHYTVKPTGFMLPAPTIQRPHPPVWVVGAAKVGAARQPSLERAARWQGWLPQVVDGDWRGNPRSPEELASMTDQVRRMREDAGLSMEHFDVCFEGEFYGSHDTAVGEPDLAAWAEAGATWWIEGAWGLQNDLAGQAELERRIQAGPPGSRP
jgi:alkanesulfonate monooxygenase SsuD/methylene tetrahydromethanopterin reductase-like flavin-dependent oxidoreductase (luciferase family)